MTPFWAGISVAGAACVAWDFISAAIVVKVMQRKGKNKVKDPEPKAENIPAMFRIVREDT